VIDQGTVIVSDGRISCVGDCDTQGMDRVIDVAGQTIIPGFVDLHAHNHAAHNGITPRRDWESAIYLAYGVTTTRDPYAWEQNVFPLGELIEAGDVIGPRTFSAGLGLWSGDAPNQNAMETYADVLHEARRLVSWGAVALKQYTLARREQRQWVVEAARTLGVPVTAETEDNVYNLSMMLDGHTGFEHTAGHVPLYSDVTTILGRLGTRYSGTLIVGGPGFPWGDQYFRQESDVWREAKQRTWLPWQTLLPATRQRPMRPETDYAFPMLAQGMADVIKAGGYGAIGSHGQQHGIGSHWDVWIMASAMTPMEALEVASLHGARHLGIDSDVGSIEVGKLGDLMVLDANPLDDIHNTVRIRYVMKAGRIYQAGSLDEVWPVARPYGLRGWIQEAGYRNDDRPVDYWDK